MIVFRINAGGVLTCSTMFPPVNRSKMVYFLRHDNAPEKLTQANFREVAILINYECLPEWLMLMNGREKAREKLQEDGQIGSL